MPSNVSLTFCGGVSEVGGNQIFFEDKGYGVKLFLDFGINMVQYANNFEKYEEPTSPEQLTRSYLLPKQSKLPIKNLYSKYFIFNQEEMNYLQKVNECKGKTDPPTDIDGILISHPHRDHYYGIGLVNRNIPIYTGVVTQRIILAYSKASRSVMSNFYEGIKWKLYRTGDIIDIKELKIFPIHVDHSIPAAYGFIIDSSEGLIIYSGDFRMHGPLSNMTQDLIDKAKSLIQLKQKNGEERSNVIDNYPNKIRALICEGTQINRGAIESEQSVGNEVIKLMDKNVYDYYLVKYNRLDWDRFRNFENIAKRYDWKYIITEKDAYFYHLLNDKAIYDTMRDPNILLDDNIYVLLYTYERYPWQTQIREIFEQENKLWRCIDHNDLKEFSNFFLFITHIYRDLLKSLPRGLMGAFISSDIDPYSEEHLDNTKTIRHDLEKEGIPSYRIHASGHAKPHDIVSFIEQINPLNLIPIHTEHPEFFKILFRNYDMTIHLPERYESIIFD
ncbi:MAG: hypothetical protein BAJALOKI3v1_570012 [Promethearchaeota archaeon]|nr:MAG: hypothetical protein BAJALOKI3v1_570012 [Candidatus Lokiarchaeota archaeon]